MSEGYEIDFLPVGDGERSGDAIALRYGADGVYTIHVVDGGTAKAGEELVAHIRKYYDNPRRIDHVVLTHGDDDHSSGLRNVIEAFEIGQIWMNRPWLYAANVLGEFKDGRWTVAGLEKRLRDDFPILVEIEDLAIAKGTPINPVFQGDTIGAFVVAAPSFERYLSLIPQFERTPAASAPAMRGLGIAITQAVKVGAEWIREAWGIETLADNPQTSMSNESSVVQYGTINDESVLLTGDAGVVSLNEACVYIQGIGDVLPGLRFMQVPHHGSRHNVSPSILNRLIGPRVGEGATINTTAFASVSKGDDSRPRKKVVNAFIRRGASVHVTKGSAKRHYSNMPERAGWVASTPLTFSTSVEA